MDDEAVLELAKAYWSEPLGGDAWGEVTSDHAHGNTPELPRLIAALAATAPSEQSWSTIGTGPIESLHYGGATGAEIATVLRATELSAVTLTGILKGVWPDLLEALGMRVHLRGLLSTAQIDWLLDDSAPGRRASL